MRKLLMICAILLTLSGMASGQEAGLPPCTEEQRAVTASYHTDHFDLMGAVMTNEMIATLSPTAHEELGDLIQNEASSETLSSYGQVLFDWRESFWEAHPICAEVFDIGTAMDESASDMAAFLAYHLAGVTAEDNPYVDGMRQGIGTFSILLSELPDQPTAAGDPEADADLPACNDDDLGILSGELAVYRALLEVPPRTYSLVGLAKYGIAQLTWRDKLWSRLPPCDLSLQVGLLMSHISSDLAVELALEIGEIADEDAPFSARIAADQARLEALSAPIAAAGNQGAFTESSAAQLPDCDDDDALAFYARNAAFPALVEALEATESVPDLLAAAKLHLAWRESLEANLPTCLPSTITAGLMLRVTGNYVAALALDIAGVMPAPDAELPIKPHLFGIVTIGVIADEISAAIEASGKTPQELIDGSADQQLPDCADGDFGLDFYNLFVAYDDLRDFAENLETFGDVMAFREAQVEWGEAYIERLPGCKQALEAGYIMYTILADYSAAYTLIIAGADVAEIPYAETIWTYRDRLDAWLQRELQ